MCFEHSAKELFDHVTLTSSSYSYYHEDGGQGWLELRAEFKSPVHLPLRKVDVCKDDDSIFGWSRRATEGVPFYACGDQQSSCEAYNQPVSAPSVPLADCSLRIISSRSTSEHLLSSADELSSNIFHSLRDLLLQLNYTVLELSSFQVSTADVLAEHFPMLR